MRILMTNDPTRLIKSASLDRAKSPVGWLRTIVTGSQSTHRRGRLGGRSLGHPLGWGKTNTNHPAARDDFPVIRRRTSVLVKLIRKAGWAFRAAIERIYAAHIEKVQMRLAPTREDRSECFAPTDLPPFFFTPTSKPRCEDRIAD